jgi:competence ComEA-like helix-hairpin-helix protein
MAADSLIYRTEAVRSRIQSFAFVIAASLSVCLSACFVVLSFVGSQSASGPPQADEISLDSRINPNYAPMASLVRLPGVGIVRAGAIVAYRKSFNRKNGNGPVFRNYDDLQKVKGIGPKTAQNIDQWLKFE